MRQNGQHPRSTGPKGFGARLLNAGSGGGCKPRKPAEVLHQ